MPAAVPQRASRRIFERTFGRSEIESRAFTDGAVLFRAMSAGISFRVRQGTPFVPIDHCMSTWKRRSLRHDPFDELMCILGGQRAAAFGRQRHGRVSPMRTATFS